MVYQPCDITSDYMVSGYLAQRSLPVDKNSFVNYVF